MDIGDPVVYTCPLCGKQTQMTTYTSYTIRSSSVFSDGCVKYSGFGSPHFTEDLAKCPYCKALFFRSSVEDARTVNFYKVKKNIKDILDADRDDLINALKNKITKKWREEKVIRENLWRDINRKTRYGHNILTGEELKIWRKNCSALLTLTKKTLNETQPEKDKSGGRDECIVMMAELNRNLGKFEEAMKLINELDSKWSWFKKQFAWECKGKNIFTFELIPAGEMRLEKAEEQYPGDYYNRGKKFLPVYYGRRNLKKAVADFNKAEELGERSADFFIERGDLHLNDLNDPDAAAADYTKALKYNDGFRKSFILELRSRAYLNNGNYKKAFKDIQEAIKDEDGSCELYYIRSEIHEAMGKTEAARTDKLMADKLYKERLEYVKEEQKKWKAIMKKIK